MSIWETRDAIDDAQRQIITGSPAGWGEVWKDTLRANRLTNQFVSEVNSLYAAYDDLTNVYNAWSGENLKNPMTPGTTLSGGPIPSDDLETGLNPTAMRMFEGFWAKVNKLADEQPELALPRDQSQLRYELEREAREAEAQARDVQSRGPTSAALLAELYSAVEDPPVLMSMMFGAGAASGVLRTALIEGAIGGGVEAFIQPQVQGYRSQIGLEAGLGEAASRVAFAAGGGAVGGAALKILGLSARGLVDEFVKRRSGETGTSAAAAAAHLDRVDGVLKETPYAEGGSHAPQFDEAYNAAVQGFPYQGRQIGQFRSRLLGTTAVERPTPVVDWQKYADNVRARSLADDVVRSENFANELRNLSPFDDDPFTGEIATHITNVLRQMPDIAARFNEAREVKSGIEAVVVPLDNEEVLRIQYSTGVTGDENIRYDSTRIVQPSGSYISEGQLIEVLPRVDTVEREEAIKAVEGELFDALLDDGLILWDQNPLNVGRLDDQYVIVDPGAVRPTRAIIAELEDAAAHGELEEVMEMHDLDFAEEALNKKGLSFFSDNQYEQIPDVQAKRVVPSPLNERKTPQAEYEEYKPFTENVDEVGRMEMQTIRQADPNTSVEGLEESLDMEFLTTPEISEEVAGARVSYETKPDASEEALEAFYRAEPETQANQAKHNLTRAAMEMDQPKVVIEENGKIKGAGAFYHRDDGVTFVSRVGSVSKGAGRKVMQAIEREAALVGNTRVELTPDTDAVGFYEALGYTVGIDPANGVRVATKTLKQRTATNLTVKDVVEDLDEDQRLIDEFKDCIG